MEKDILKGERLRIIEQIRAEERAKLIAEFKIEAEHFQAKFLDDFAHQKDCQLCL